MGFFRNPERAAVKQYEQATQIWQVKRSIYDAGLHALYNAMQGSDGRSRLGLSLRLAAGECALWCADAALIEIRVRGGSWQGHSQGVSFHVAKGVNYRVGAVRGHYVPGPEVQSPIDQGQCVVTTTRALFIGSKITREWSFAKMLDHQASADGTIVMLPVSNRQKVSGLAAGAATDFWIAVGSSCSDGIRPVYDELYAVMNEHLAAQPAIAASTSER